MGGGGVKRAWRRWGGEESGKEVGGGGEESGEEVGVG